MNRFFHAQKLARSNSFARSAAVLACMLASLAGSTAQADWTHDFSDDEQYAPDWFLAGTTVTGQFVSGNALGFTTRPGANDGQVGVLGSGMSGAPVSTAIALAAEAEDDYTIVTIVNADVAEATGQQGVVLRVNDNLEGYSATIDFDTGELVLASFDLPANTTSTILTQPLINFDASTAYAIVAIVDDSSLVVEAYDLFAGIDDDDDFEEVALAAAASTPSIEIARGYAGLISRGTTATTPTEATFVFAGLETIDRETDFNGDNEDDLFWLNEEDGSVWVWTMDDDAILGAQYIGAVPAGWRLISTTDFDDDNRADLLWFNDSTGEVGAWESGPSGFTYRGIGSLNPTQWELEGCGELTGDSMSDLVWRNRTTNELWVWEMNRFEIDDARAFFAAPAGWEVQAIADMNRDGDDDLIFRNVGGANGIFTMDDTNTVSWVGLPFVGGNWNIVGLTDINDDDETDLLWRNNDTGECATWEMDDTSFGSFAGFPSVGTQWQPAN
jgi:hypothetical protein